MQPLIISVIGKDKTGLVDALAKKVYQHGGNWQGSSFAHMAGMFTGFVEVLAPKENHESLIAALDALPELSVRSVSATNNDLKDTTELRLDIMGNDKTGIVQELTAVLNEFNLNIVNFDSTCESAPNWGSLMFKASAVIAVPEGFDEERLQRALENLANDLVVDIHTTH